MVRKPVPLLRHNNKNMNARKKLNIKRTKRAARSSARIKGTAERPRLAVYRSNRALYAQLIDDVTGRTLASISSLKGTGNKSLKSLAAGEALAKKAVEKGIKAVVFDRRSYKFHGRVKSFADGAKKGGLKI